MSSAPKFVTGSTLRHVINMTASGSIGLVAVFIVDALNLFYISRLGQAELAAAVGYAGTLLFFHTSIAIGLSIAATALVSRALGSGNRAYAQELAGASLLIMGGIMTLLTLLFYPFLLPMVKMIGATGQTADLAVRFMHFVLPSVPIVAIGMCMSALLRAVGDAKRAMYVTLGAAACTAVLDPILIFGFNLGLDGAAIATSVARLTMLTIGFHGLIRVHQLFKRPSASLVKAELPAYFAIAMPAVLTQVATPVGNTFVTEAMAGYGDAAVAAWSVIGRLIPVAFGVIFALSGAIGPIIGQNLGAKQYGRIRSTVRDSLKVTLIYVLCMWAILSLARHYIAQAFGAQGQAHDLIVFFCVVVSASFLFNGTLFVANAAFNNLGYAFYSTMLNWGRSTLGVIPFVWLGSHYFGATGVLAGYGLGVVIFGVIGGILCFKVIDQLESKNVAT
ncbi:MAG: MATE family efflux transporter [Formosimonas sp.]